RETHLRCQSAHAHPFTIAAAVQIRVHFFFQAEDGIRDGHVTGVQTCALPILPPPRRRRARSPGGRRSGRSSRAAAAGTRSPGWRSEERRVGKECRARVAGDEAKNKKRGKVCER